MGFRPSIVTYGRLSEEFYHYVRQKHPELEISLATSKEELNEGLKTANCYAGFNALNGLDISNLRWIHVFGAGVDSYLNNPTISNSDILISRSYGKMGRLIGEYCVAHILNIYQNLSDYFSLQKEKIWEQKTSYSLSGKAVLILGTGTIGQGIAEKLSPFNCKIIGMNRSGKTPPDFHEVISPNELSEVSKQIDICINCLPLTWETKGLIDGKFLQTFLNAIFINVGRGGTIQSEDVIIDALDQGQLSKAILDVFPKEPLPSSSLFWNHPKVVITPHVSGISTLEDVVEGFEHALNAYLKGNSDPFVDKKKEY